MSTVIDTDRHSKYLTFTNVRVYAHPAAITPLRFPDGVRRVRPLHGRLTFIFNIDRFLKRRCSGCLSALANFNHNLPFARIVVVIRSSPKTGLSAEQRGLMLVMSQNVGVKGECRKWAT